MRNSTPLTRISRPSMRARAITAPRISLISGLWIITGLLLVTYVGLMAFTMTYAVMRSQYAQEATDESGRIGTLETTYFNALAQVNTVDPTAFGYVTPTTQLFALAPSAPAVAMAAQ